MPSEKLPPKKKRLRLADMEHSSGESSFESTCTSLSRSPSQESNLSHSSSFSMSFDKEEAIKSMSPTKQEDSMSSVGVPKQSEFLTVPGTGHSGHHQQREMRRSSSEQAPCTLPSELSEMRSKSFDYGSLSSSRQGEVYSSASGMKERRRGFLVRQPSLSVYPEAVVQESSSEMTIKKEDHGSWSSGDVMRSKRLSSGVAPSLHAQYILQQSISEDSLQDEPLHVRAQHYRLQTQGSSSEGEHQEACTGAKMVVRSPDTNLPFKRNNNFKKSTTKAALALLRSKQKRYTDWIFTTAALMPQSSGKLVSSVAWKLRFDQLKPELMPVDVSKFGKKMKGVVSWDRSKDEPEQKEVSVKPAIVEPTRIKIFEGGYKSNEDYVYVRGRGRGKYICEECGIRCKKPSMLKKHIRTHTDVRPYVCKYCNFAFKTKGNLTKHMKSKAHMKKCLELGVSMSSVEDIEADEGDTVEERSEKLHSSLEPHQFSDADDSDGEDLDEDEEDEEDDYDGDSTPKTRSRSTSPQPYGLPAMSITSVAPHLSLHPPVPAGSPDILGHNAKPPPSLFGYFTTVPSIQITPQAAHPVDPKEQFQRGMAVTRLLAPPSVDEDLSISSSDLCPPSRLSSPGLDTPGCPSPISPSSSPSARRYLSPRRELSSRPGHLSPRRDNSPLRHVSPKRDIGAGSYRRDLSPRRGHLSLLSPLSRPTSPGGSRDFKRDLSPRGRHRGMIRPVSPRRGLQHQHLLYQSPHSGARSLRAGLQSGLLGQTRASADMETDHLGSSPPDGNRGSPPHQVLFSHLPLHSQLQVRSPFPMIPIGGIQMVHSVPASVTSPLPQHDASCPRVTSLQKSTSEDSNPGDRTPPHPQQNVSPSPQSPPDPCRPAEPEEGIQNFTDNFSSLCIDAETNADEGKSHNTPLHFSQSPTPGPSPESTQGSKEPAS
uniref:C2H2-type domain-containing protein n=1 Tax=Knipowitschia caucasica TaxID=637954 RepID=A0AAV2KCJ5_KNICA